MPAPPPQLQHLLAADVRAHVAARARRRAADAVIGAGPARFEDLQTFVSLVRRSHGALIAAVSIVTTDRQTYLAIDGIDMESTRVRDEVSFCAHIVAAGQPLVVTEALHDRRFAANPFVADHVVGSYAGVPLRDAKGFVVGTLCVFAAAAGGFDASAVTVLTEDARTVQALLGARARAQAPRAGARGRLLRAARRRARRTEGLAFRLPYRSGRRPRRGDAGPARRSRTPWVERLTAWVVNLLQALLAAFVVAIVVAASANHAEDPVGAGGDVATTRTSASALAAPSTAAAAVPYRSAPSTPAPLAPPSETGGLFEFGSRLPALDLPSPELTVRLPDPGVVLSWGSSLPAPTGTSAAPGHDTSSPGTDPPEAAAHPTVAFILTLAVAAFAARRRRHAGPEPSDDAAASPTTVSTGHRSDEAADAEQADAPDAAARAPEPGPGPGPGDTGPADATRAGQVAPEAPPSRPEPRGHPAGVDAAPPSSPGPDDSSTRATVVYVDPRRPDVPVETVHVIRTKRTGKVHR